MIEEKDKIKLEAYCDILELLYKRMGVCHDSIITHMRDGDKVRAGNKIAEAFTISQIASDLATKIQFVLNAPK